MLRVSVENTNSFTRTHAYDRNGQLITKQFDRIHHLPLLYARAGQQRMKLINDQHLHMAGAEKMDHLVSQLGYGITGSIGSEEALQNGNKEPFLIGGGRCFSENNWLYWVRFFVNVT